MIKPVVYISECITFKPVRYNGQIISSEFVERLKPFIKPITHCPEVEIGLGVPREPLRIIAKNKNFQDLRLIQTKTGIDFTEAIKNYSNKILSEIEEIDGFILKSKSPSCGIKDVKIYTENLKSPITTKGSGFFGKEVFMKFPYKIVEDEGRLNDYFIRDNFLKCIFLSAEFRKVKEDCNINKLIKFQQKHKLLFMSYNQEIMKEMGRIVANWKKIGFQKACQLYEELLGQILSKPYKKSNLINSFEHTFGYFKNGLSKAEKQFFLSCLKKFSDGKISSGIIITLIKSYILRFNENYLSGQSLFNPYPEELL